MKFNSKVSSLDKLKTGCLIVGVYETSKLTAQAKSINESTNNLIKKVLKKGDLSGNIGQTLLLQDPLGVSASRILLVGCGKEKTLNATAFNNIIGSILPILKSLGCTEASCCLHELPIENKDQHWAISQAIQLIQASEDSSDKLKSNKKAEPPTLKKLQWLAENKTTVSGTNKAIAEGTAIAQGISLAKELGDLPGNICTPSYLAEQAKKMGKQFKPLRTQILDEKKMQSLGMGSLLSVSKGSREPAKMIIMEYNGGKKNQKPIVLVGKGLTFDAGGISLKPGAGMDEMKYDMCGGASVFGAMQTLCELNLPLNVVGVVPASENMPDGLANKPGDIVTSMSGQTIEILNTDAEGRLILCDALTYSERFNPDVVIDIATLTGACIVALGNQASGLFSNHPPLSQALLSAGDASGDRCWELPIWDEYQEQLNSNFADMANIGGKGAGSITAACFLSRYTKKYHWAHIDIAGTAWLSGGNKGATGRPVPLLVNYLLSRC